MLFRVGSCARRHADRTSVDVVLYDVPGVERSVFVEHLVRYAVDYAELADCTATTEHDLDLIEDVRVVIKQTVRKQSVSEGTCGARDDEGNDLGVVGRPSASKLGRKE